MIKPPCHNWGAWYGPEVEGKDSIGKGTLFLRRTGCLAEARTEFRRRYANSEPDREYTIERIWFCKEYENPERDRDIRIALNEGYEVAIEVTPESILTFSHELRLKCKVYLKLDLQMFPGDHVCVGEAFYDEAFRLGDGVKAHPRLYANDWHLLNLHSS